MENKKNERKGHPTICPKCKYNRPLALTYCPHCRELETKPKGVIVTEKLQKMGVTVGDAKILPSNNTDDARADNQRENTQQKEPKTANRYKTNKLQVVPRARKRATKKTNKPS